MFGGFFFGGGGPLYSLTISSLLFIDSFTIFILQVISYANIFELILLPLINITLIGLFPVRSKCEPHSSHVKNFVIPLSVCRQPHFIPLNFLQVSLSPISIWSFLLLGLLTVVPTGILILNTKTSHVCPGGLFGNLHSLASII